MCESLSLRGEGELSSITVEYLSDINHLIKVILKIHCYRKLEWDPAYFSFDQDATMIKIR